MSSLEIYYWEKMNSPHKAGLLSALSRQGYKVTYVVESKITPDRLIQGWSEPRLQGVHLELISSAVEIERLIKRSEPQAIHICDGIRSNGMVVYARSILKRNGCRFWVFMETVEDQGWRGLIKRIEYRRLFWKWRKQLMGVLSAGLRTSQWVIECGVPPEKVYPFAYFLPHHQSISFSEKNENRPFHFIFVGQLNERKRVDLLIDGLEKIINTADFKLIIIGTGPLNDVLQTRAERCLKDRVVWIGKLPLEEVPSAMAKADCLVLPSRHDGWGAVVSEALMAGTPVICSDHCGAAVAVEASGHGGVFQSGNVKSLSEQLLTSLLAGPLSTDQRTRLSEWARCLGAEAGAEYFINIIKQKPNSLKPPPPWQLCDVKAYDTVGHSLLNISTASQE